MYDRHNPIIKWYEYDHSKLYETAEAEDVTGEAAEGADTAGEADGSISEATPDEAAQEEVLTDAAEDTGTSSGSGDPSLDDEVARIMAAFSGAKQNNVDDVFAMMAAEEAGNTDGGDAGAADAGASDSGAATDAAAGSDISAEDQDALIASICAPKQNNVDDLVMMAREA